MITLLVYLLLCALLVIGIRYFVPESSQPIKNLMVYVVVFVAVILILEALGILDLLRGMKTPRV